MKGTQYIWILNGISLILTSGALAGNPLRNVALNKKAVQSSQFTYGAAGKAVDGNRDPRYEHGSCSSSDNDSDPWWRVDLQNVYGISAVMITNRDALEDRLDGAEIWIGNSLETNVTKNFRCAVISHIPSGRTFYFQCEGAEGRYVTVVLPGSNKFLTLCEVEVYSVNYAYPLPNLALKRDATQSSTLSFADASKAIDGRRDSYYHHWDCSHTAEDKTDPWWRVDLGRTYEVTSVKVTNRGDCCAERLDGAEIRIGNSLENNGNNNPRCASISHIRAGKTSTYYCDGGGMEGRFVNVIIPGKRKTLTLCEVEVYSASAAEPLPNVALRKQTAQSSSTFYSSRQGSEAVSGCTDGDFSNGCCTHTVQQSDPWWRVDLLAVHKVSAVTLINRKDCCSERLLGAQILIGNSPSYSGNKRCSTLLSLEGTTIHTFQCADTEGRYVHVMIPGHYKILTLCEVEVYASLAEPEAMPEVTSSPPPPTVNMLLSGRNVTVVGERLCWSDALLYCRRHHWDLLCLRSEEEQSEVERLLSDTPFQLTDYVWLGLRRYVIGDTWFWMSGHSMKFTKWPGDSPPSRYSSPCGGMAIGEHFLWEDQSCEKLLNFICQSGAEDGAQRVYFYSSHKATTP